ncbi:MAG TPA: hypothetical protein VMW91_01085 [Desulfosporosinus sp.]|nr:hypothetical protein [Desulfosporosinus sp.]
MGRFISSFTTYTLEVVVKLASAGGSPVPSFYIYMIDNGIKYTQMGMGMHSSAGSGNPRSRYDTNGYTGANQINYPIDATTSTWVTSRIVVTGTGGSMHSFVNGQYYDFITFAGTDPTASANQIGVGCPNQGVATTVYVDQIKVSSTQEESTQIAPLRVQGETIVSRLGSVSYAGWTFGGSSHDDPVRFVYGGGNMSTYFPYCIPYVSTGHANASPLRIYDNAATYAFLQHPALP